MSAHVRCSWSLDRQATEPEITHFVDCMRANKEHHNRNGKWTPDAFLTMSFGDSLIFTLARLLDDYPLGIGKDTLAQYLSMATEPLPSPHKEYCVDCIERIFDQLGVIKTVESEITNDLS